MSALLHPKSSEFRHFYSPILCIPGAHVVVRLVAASFFFQWGLAYNMGPVAPAVYQVVLEPAVGQFREFESPRVHTRVNTWGLVLFHNSICGKRESVT